MATPQLKLATPQLKLREACRTGSLFNLRFAAREGGDVNIFSANESPPIILAAAGGHSECIKALCKSKAYLEATDVPGGR